MAYYRHTFFRLKGRTVWSDPLSVIPTVTGVDHQFDYWFGWNSHDTFYVPTYISPDFSDPTALNSADYALDPTHGIARLQVRTFDNLYPDTTNLHGTVQGWLRRRNVSYCLGPDYPGTTGDNLFRNGWAIWSNPDDAGGILAARVNDTGTGWETGWGPGVQVYDFSTVVGFPAFTSQVPGYKANFTGCFDMASKPVLAWESAVDTISVLRVNEGLITFSGYSPSTSCNAAFLTLADRFVNTDTVIYYLKDINGYTSPWVYPTLLGPDGTDNGSIQSDDTRRSSALYYRLQRDNFDVEYKMCDLPVQAQHIDHQFFDGKTWDPSYVGGVYSDGTIYRADTPVTMPLVLSVIDGSSNRYVLQSYPYNTRLDPVVPASATNQDSITVSSAVTGSIESVVISESTTPDSITVTPSVSGEIVTSIISDLEVDTLEITTVVSGSNLTTVVSDSPTPDSITISTVVSGAVATQIITTVPQIDSTEITPSVSGSLVTV